MKRIVIICEGHTEQEFCKDVLNPYFFSKGIIIQTPLIKKSAGGIVKWEILKKEIETYLKQENDIFLTLLIDYYGINTKHNFPDWIEAHKNTDIKQSITKLENAMKNDIDKSVNFRFIPYIQLHEFEALLFCGKDVFDKIFEKNEFSDYRYLIQTLNQFPNPEDINDGLNTSPSKRLEKIISGYDKIVYGSIIAKEIGLYEIRKKAPHFNEWINKIESLTK